MLNRIITSFLNTAKSCGLSLCVIVFISSLFNFSGPLRPLWQTLKMQNKPKLKTARNFVIPLLQRTNKTAQCNPQSKNKAKQTQTKVAQSSRLSVTPASSRQLKITTKVNPVILSKENLVNPVKNKKMTSKPNLKNSKITLSGLSTTGYRSLMAVDRLKSKPNQSQYLSPGMIRHLRLRWNELVFGGNIPSKRRQKGGF